MAAAPFIVRPWGLHTPTLKHLLPQTTFRRRQFFVFVVVFSFVLHSNKYFF